jgi:hypothetical protein
MSKRRGKQVLPFPSGQPSGILEKAQLSDASKAMWRRFRDNLERNVQMANASINAAGQQAVVDFADLLLAINEKDPEQGWRFNVVKSRFEKYPLPPEDSGT